MKHKVDCKDLNSCKITLPSENDKWFHFKNYSYKKKCPFIIYADTESILYSIDDFDASTDNSRRYQKHETFSIGYYLNCSYDPSLNFYRSYRGKNCQQWFANELKELAENVDAILLNEVPMDEINEELNFQLRTQTRCHICELKFEHSDIRVIDHCHLTGKVIGMAHQSCNLNYQDSRTIPVVFHNLSGYDAHFIIKDIALAIEGRIHLLPINKEKYIAFTKYVQGTEIKLRFIDSFRFLPASIEKLSSHYTDFELLKKEFPSSYELLSRKGVFPYDYIDSWEKLEETELPQKENFYSQLYESNITDGDYIHAQNVWQNLNIKTLGEYADIYLKTDVLLLTEIFENFRASCLESHRLDPAHYFTTPGFSWDAMLFFTKIKLELITDIDMILFIERGIRGGVSQCSKRYSKANNKYMNCYNPKDYEKYIMYLDANNLYGWAMCQYLPTGNFKWIENTNNININNIPDDSDIGYILEVDLDYPHELHDSHQDLPLTPIHMNPPNSKNSKLLLTLHDKKRYVIHYRALKTYLKYGLTLKKIHRILQFDQSNWLKGYIDLNTKLRATAKTDFQKEHYKLINNAIFGKTMENVRKRHDIKLLTKWNGRYGAKNMIAKPNFHSRTIFDENLVAVELKKLEILLNKPIYIGQAVLDISKICLYDFHYGYMKKVYNNNCKCLYTDTDSLIYELTEIDPYKIIKRDIDYFDTSDYPINNTYNIPLANKKIPGLMKDELCGKIVTEFVGLRAKMYSIRVDHKDHIKKAKGVKSYVIKNSLSFSDYVDCLTNNTEIEKQQNCIRSYNHQVFSIRSKKKTLSPFDDKRYLIDSTNTLPWGHYSLSQS